MSKPLRRWFKLGGQPGDRSVEDQLRGLQPALAAAKGKTVLDLGCAEGAISLEFAKAGATHVRGLELHEGHLEVARQICAGYPCDFVRVDLNTGDYPPPSDPVDIVLALAVIHKLEDPESALSWYADAARELVVLRLPAWADKASFRHERGHRGLIDCARILAPLRFSLERIERGPSIDRGQEPVVYFRRRSA